MNRRDLLTSAVLLGVPKPTTDFNTCDDILCLPVLVAMLKNAVRFEMPNAQWVAYNAMTAYASEKDMAGAVGVMATLPITVNEKVPKDQIWLVGHDGTLISKITNLAVPTGY